MEILLAGEGMSSELGTTAAHLRRQILGVFCDARLIHTNEDGEELLRFSKEPFGLRRQDPDTDWDVCRLVFHPAANCRPAWRECQTLVMASADTAVEWLVKEVALWRLERRRVEMESEVAL